MISIIVPFYNSEKYIERCIQSLINQTYKDFEIILVDDGSLDHSYSICSKYVPYNDNLRLFKISNHGVGYARSFGIQQARGDFLTFCDADDFYDQSRLEKLVKYESETDADIIINGHYAVSKGQNIKISKNSQYLNKDDVFKSIMLDDSIGGFCWNKLFKSSIIKDAVFPSELICCEDTYFLFSCMQNASLIYYVSDPLNFYCDNPNSATRDLNNVISYNLRSNYTIAYEKILSDFTLSEKEKNYIKIMIFRTSLGIRKSYVNMNGNDKDFVKNLTFDLKKYGKYYYRSKEFSLRQKLRSLLTEISVKF